MKTDSRSRALFGGSDEELSARAATGEDLCVLKQTGTGIILDCMTVKLFLITYKGNFVNQ